MNKTAKQAKRERVEDINKCGTLACVGEYLEDNPFRVPQVQKLLEHALYKPTNLNFTQYQLALNSIEINEGDLERGVLHLPEGRAYAVLLRIMEIRFGLDKLELEL